LTAPTIVLCIMNKIDKTRKIIVWLLVIVIIVWGGYVLLNKPKPASGESIKIGVIITGTGVGALQGEWARQGVELAREEINAAGGVRGRLIELIFEDSKTELAAAVSAANKLINVDGVKSIIGDSWTSTTVAVEPVINKNGVLLIAPLVTLDSLSKDDLLFRLMPVTKSMMESLAHYVYGKMGGGKVAFLSQETTFGVEHVRDFKAVFESLGGIVVAEESFNIKATDLRSQIVRVKAAKPDVVFNLHATGPIMGVLMRQAKELGLNARWIGSWGSENGSLLREHSDVIEGLVYPYPYNVESNDPAVQRFVGIYNARYNEPPNFVAASFYDSLKLLAQAIGEVGENTTELKSYLTSVKDYQGASGTFSFDENGDVERPIVIKAVKNGQFVRLEN